MGKVADKLLLFIYSLSVLVLAAAALSVAFEWVSPEAAGSFVASAAGSGTAKYVLIAVCAVLLLISVRFLFLSVRPSRERYGSIDRQTDYGDIRVSLETVENLALKAASRIRGVKDLRVRVRVDDRGLDIQLRSVIDGESPIPQLTEDIQRGVKAYIEDITGIPVAGVTVYVANVVPSQPFRARVE